MKRSKIETYVDILTVLSSMDSVKITHLMYKTNVNCTILKGYVNYLIQQELAEEKTLPNQRTAYSITQRGLTVLTYLKELSKVFPIIEVGQNQE